MNKYEILYILDTKLDDAEKDALIERFKGVVETAGGSVEGVDKWGVKKLAYEINKLTEGDYILVNFHADPARIAELDRILRINDAVVRHMIVRRDDRD